MSVKDRIKTYSKYHNIPISEFERSIGVANGYVNSISKSIGIDKLETILEIYPNMNIEWLLTGHGEMLKSDTYNDVTKPVSHPPGQAEYLERENDLLRSQNEFLKEQIKSLTHIIELHEKKPDPPPPLKQQGAPVKPLEKNKPAHARKDVANVLV